MFLSTSDVEEAWRDPFFFEFCVKSPRELTDDTRLSGKRRHEDPSARCLRVGG
jgi:uncharacterized protein YecE (DUF72 family)